MTSASAQRRLMMEYKQLTAADAAEKERSMFTAGPIDENDLFHWEALLCGPDETPFGGGLFRALLDFPTDYPLSPFTMRFDPPLLHPNIYPDGKVCISILHSPGDDPLHYESASERWSPVQSIEKVILSVLSLLAEPNLESPANVDCAKMYREHRTEYIARVKAHIAEAFELDL